MKNLQETSEVEIQNLDDISTSTSLDASITRPSLPKNLVPLLTNTKPSIQTQLGVQSYPNAQAELQVQTQQGP